MSSQHVLCHGPVASVDNSIELSTLATIGRYKNEPESAHNTQTLDIHHTSYIHWRLSGKIIISSGGKTSIPNLNICGNNKRHCQSPPCHLILICTVGNGCDIIFFIYSICACFLLLLHCMASLELALKDWIQNMYFQI